MSLDALRKKLDKDYGKTLTRQEVEPQAYEALPTGSVGLDYATGIGGYVRGRIQMLWGPESVGKTTLAICGMAEAQKTDTKKQVGYIDMEQTFDWKWARALGLDTSEKRIMHVYPSSSEDVSDLLRKMIRSNEFSEIWVDSIGGMVAKDATEKDAAEYSVGRNAQIITRMCQANTVFARQHNVAVCLISQVRADFKSQRGFDTFAGPKNLRHSLSMRLALARTGQNLSIKEDEDSIQVGTGIRVKVEENKMAPRGRTAEITIINVATKSYGAVGLEHATEALTLATKPSVAVIEQQPGGWYTMPGGERIKGRDKVLARLREDLDLTKLIRDRAIESVKSQVIMDEPDVEFVQDMDVEPDPVPA